MTDAFDVQTPIGPLPEQVAERDMSPPERCASQIRYPLPKGVELWSCYRNQVRFVRAAADDVPPQSRNVDQQVSIRYGVFDDAEGLAEEIRQKAVITMSYVDLAPRRELTLLGPVSDWSIRGQLYTDGSIAGSGFFLIDPSGRAMCDVAKQDSVNPYAVCKVIDGSRVLEIQLPNRLVVRLGEFIEQAKRLAELVGKN